MGLNREDKIILYSGRIEPPKKVTEIIKAFKFLNLKSKNSKLLIVGDGTRLYEMKQLVQELNLNKSVIFLGYRKRDELPEIINCADISVLYSDNEGSPLSVKESLACGVPVVANRVGDIDDLIVNKENGYILQKESIEKLAELMSLCLNNATNMKYKCIESVQKYSVESINKRIFDVYKEIV